MRTILSFTILLLLLSVEAYADQITLKNGDRVTGKIVKTDGGKLLVNTDLLGNVSIELASVSGEYRINFDASLITDISRRIGWQVTVSDRYLSNPPGFEKNDLLLTTGLKIKLGKF